jgi:hypothetical protein
MTRPNPKTRLARRPSAAPVSVVDAAEEAAEVAAVVAAGDEVKAGGSFNEEGFLGTGRHIYREELQGDLERMGGDVKMSRRKMSKCKSGTWRLGCLATKQLYESIIGGMGIALVWKDI